MARRIRSGYARREPEATILHKVVRENLETLLAEARSGDPGGRGLPRYVEQELRDYLVCGVLSAGFSLWRCTKCGQQTPVAFSCKTRVCLRA
ncbi:MAG: transposase zinc-binding domain-containing protein [Myxococcales bacterium]